MREAQKHALQRTHTENLTQILPENEQRGHSPNFHIHVSVRNLYNPKINLAVLLQEICGPILGIYICIAHRNMNVEIRIEAPQFPEKEYINGFFVSM